MKLKLEVIAELMGAMPGRIIQTLKSVGTHVTPL